MSCDVIKTKLINKTMKKFILIIAVALMCMAAYCIGFTQGQIELLNSPDYQTAPAPDTTDYNAYHEDSDSPIVGGDYAPINVESGNK